MLKQRLWVRANVRENLTLVAEWRSQSKHLLRGVGEFRPENASSNFRQANQDSAAKKCNLASLDHGQAKMGFGSVEAKAKQQILEKRGTLQSQPALLSFRRL